MALAGFSYYKTISIDNTKIDATLTDFTVPVHLTNSNFSRWSELQGDGDDVQFTNTSDSLLKFSREFDPTTIDGTNLVAHYKCEDNASSSTVTDAQGSHNGTMVNDENNYTSEQSTTGYISNGFNFDGTNDYFTVADHNDFTFGDGTNDSAFSVSFWFKADSVSGIKTMCGKMNAYNDGEWYIYLSDGSINFTLIDDSSNKRKITYSVNNAIETGTWYHVCCTYDGDETSTTNQKIFLNGVRIDTLTYDDGYTAMENSSRKLAVGAEADGGNPFDGVIDNVRIYNAELTVNQAIALYHDTDEATSVSYASYRVKVPSVASGSDTDFRVWYVNGSATDQSDATNTWSSFDQVHLLNDNAASTTVTADKGDNGALEGGDNTVRKAGGGKIGGSLFLNGVDDVVSMGNTTNYEYSDAFSFIGYVRQTTAVTNEIIVAKRESAGVYRGWEILWNSSSKLIVQIINSYNVKELIVTSDSAYSDLDWIQVGFSYDGSGDASGVTIYKDGAAVADTDTSDDLSSSTIQNSVDLQYGARSDTAIFGGTISNFMIAGSELSAAWFKADYNGVWNTLLSFGSEETPSGVTYNALFFGSNF